MQLKELERKDDPETTRGTSGKKAHGMLTQMGLLAIKSYTSTTFGEYTPPTWSQLPKRNTGKLEFTKMMIAENKMSVKYHSIKEHVKAMYAYSNRIL